MGAVVDELVRSGGAGSIDPLGIGDFLTPERLYIAKVADAIGDVICRTERHEHGIVYSVMMMLGSDEGWSDQGGDHEHEVWQRFVRFGTTEASQAGGHLFRVASQDQEAIGAYVWRAMVAADPRCRACIGDGWRMEADAAGKFGPVTCTVCDGKGIEAKNV